MGKSEQKKLRIDEIREDYKEVNTLIDKECEELDGLYNMAHGMIRNKTETDKFDNSLSFMNRSGIKDDINIIQTLTGIKTTKTSLIKEKSSIVKNIHDAEFKNNKLVVESEIEENDELTENVVNKLINMTRNRDIDGSFSHNTNINDDFGKIEDNIQMNKNAKSVIFDKNQGVDIVLGGSGEYVAVSKTTGEVIPDYPIDDMLMIKKLEGKM